MAEALPEASKDTSQVQPPSIPPLPNPSAGSANPAASFPALWGYIEPALDHIVRSPTNNPTKAPAIAVDYHIGIHTAVYNYFTGQSDPFTGALTAAMEEKASTTGSDLYEQLDRYYADVCRELLLGSPDDDTSLIYYLVPCFNRYSAGAYSINRLLNYVNRHFVKRAVEEDKGWLRLSDMLDAVAQSIKSNDTREKIAKKWREQREVELKKWGLVDGASAEQIARAETSAEAASPLDRIVPLSSIAHRRFRIEVLEPLLSVPKAKKKPKGKARGSKKPVNAADIPLVGQKGRLARAINLLEMKEGQESIQERKKLARDLDNVLGSSGVKADHPLRKRLQRFGRSESATLK